ncbi:MAG: dihydropteroate synthase-like protein [Candidatus Helarchaeota archaeon]
MKKALILTGMDAFDLVRSFTRDISEKIEVKKMPISIAAFMTPTLIENWLNSMNLDIFEFVMVPGLMKGNLSEISDRLNIPIYKGPKYAADISKALDHVDKLSSSRAADFLFQQADLDMLQEAIQKYARETACFPLGQEESRVFVGTQTFPIILGEIVDAPKLSVEENLQIALQYVDEGANVIDLGCMVKKKNPEKIKEILTRLKKNETLKNVPFSIDSLNPEEIIAGVEAGAELVLSIDAGNIEVLNSIPDETAIVVLPTNVREGFMPQTPENRVKKLKETIKHAKGKGFTRIIADPLLESPIMPGLYKSLKSYELFQEQEQSIPLMFGIGNVTELVDADSTGLNMLLACLALELNVSVLLTTEYSPKSRLSINELSIALQMCFIARLKRTPPKDMALSLLRAKSKIEFMPPLKLEGLDFTPISPSTESFEFDQKGYFKIWVNHFDKQINVIHYDLDNSARIAFQAPSARDLCAEINRRALVSLNEHASYLGRELEKAEICLKLGKSYIQDDEIW